MSNVAEDPYTRAPRQLQESVSVQDTSARSPPSVDVTPRHLQDISLWSTWQPSKTGNVSIVDWARIRLSFCVLGLEAIRHCVIPVVFRGLFMVVFFLSSGWIFSGLRLLFLLQVPMCKWRPRQQRWKAVLRTMSRRLGLPLA